MSLNIITKITSQKEGAGLVKNNLTHWQPMRCSQGSVLQFFSATKQDRVCPSVQSINTLFTFVAFYTHCTVGLGQ